MSNEKPMHRSRKYRKRRNSRAAKRDRRRLAGLMRYIAHYYGGEDEAGIIVDVVTGRQVDEMTFVMRV